MMDDVEIGKCDGCSQIIYDVNNMTDEVRIKMRDYGVKAVPTAVIDGEIKIVGIPDFPWTCGEDLYGKLKKVYPLER